MPKSLVQAPLVVILHAESKNASHFQFGAPNPKRRHREKKTCVVTKNFPCDQNCPKLLEIWAGGSLRGTILGHRGFNQDSKPILILFPLLSLGCSTQFCLQAPYQSLCTHVSCPVMITHLPQYVFISIGLLQ